MMKYPSECMKCILLFHLFTDKRPKQYRLLLLIDKRPQIVHTSGRDSDTTLTAWTMKGDVLFPTPFVDPTGTMNHQASCIRRLIIKVHAFKTETTLQAVPVILCYEKSAQGWALASWSIAEVRLFCGTSPTRPMHHVGTCNDLLTLKIPYEQSRFSWWNAVINKQSIVLVHIMSFGKGEGFFCSLLDCFILPAIREFWKSIIFPCPIQATYCCHND